MPIFFENDLLVVKQGFLGPWRVVDKRRGVTISPETELKRKIGLIWIKVRKRLGAPPELRRAAEDYMFMTFGLSSIDPRGPVASLFRGTEPDELVDAIYIQAASILCDGNILTEAGPVRVTAPRAIDPAVEHSALKYELGGGRQLWISGAAQRLWVRDPTTTWPLEADPADAEKFFDVLNLLMRREDTGNGEEPDALKKMVHRVVLGGGVDRWKFRNYSDLEICLALEQHCWLVARGDRHPEAQCSLD